MWHDHQAVARLIVAVRPSVDGVQDRHAVDPSSGRCTIWWTLGPRCLAQVVIDPAGGAEAQLHPTRGALGEMRTMTSSPGDPWPPAFTFQLSEHLAAAAREHARGGSCPSCPGGGGAPIPVRSVLLFTKTPWCSPDQAGPALAEHRRLLAHLGAQGLLALRCTVDDDGLLHDVVMSTLPVEQARISCAKTPRSSPGCST